MDREAQLVVVVNLPGGAVEVTRFAEVDRPVQIGSSAACQVRISLQHVFPVHAEVVLSGWSLHVMDRSNGNLYGVTGAISSLELPYLQPTSVVLRGTGVSVELTSGIQDEGHLSAQDKVRVVAISSLQSRSSVRPIEDAIPSERGPGGRIDATLLTPGAREEFTFHDEIATTIGRTRACRIRVPDDVEGVSRTHARLSWDNGWLVLEDLGSTNGTWINNQRIKRVVLRPSAHHHVELGQPGASLSVRVVSERARRAPFATPSAMARPNDGATDRAIADAKGIADRLAAKREQAGDAARLADELETHRRQLDQQRQLLDTFERRRVAAEAEWERQWSQIDAERRVLQQERRQLDEERQRRTFADSEDTDPTLTSLVEVDEALQWLMALPEPDRDVFRHLATHGLVNEEEATRILGGPRHFRRFSLRFETHLAQCPFKVRIDTTGKVKCYVRDD